MTHKLPYNPMLNSSKTLNNMKPSQSGVTLLEMLIVVAIFAIITAIAIPNYRSYRERANLAEAKNNITKIHQDLAADKLINPRNYLTQAKVKATLAKLKNNIPANEQKKYTYTYTVKQQGKAIYFYIQAAPTSTTDKYYLWSDQNGAVYKCSGKASSVSNTKPGSCEDY